MQIVIDIDDELYEKVRNAHKGIFIDIYKMMVKAILHGTPLPKGHGRLIDIDKVEWYGCTSESDCPHKDRECKDCNRAKCSKTQVDAIPTIIEAESEE